MTNEIGYEVDFLPVGDGEKSGDAIALRYGNLHGPTEQQTIITIDGGTVASGEALVEHVKKYYGTDRVDMAFLSHPDNDHASGMRTVVEELNVRQIVMHLPWKHSAAVSGLLGDGRVTLNGLSERARNELCSAYEIAELADEYKIPVIEPFAGQSTPNGELIVLGPTPQFYQSMLANFAFMPDAEVEPVTFSFAEMFKTAKAAVLDMIPETWAWETLADAADDATSAENNSSVIFLLQVAGKKLLFTGDAGVLALTNAADFAALHGISLAGISFAQVPHHGSRRNVGKTILNRIFGPPRPTDAPDWTAFVSASKGAAPKHPHKKVTNAFNRRGARVIVTAGTTKRQHHNAPDRGWAKAEPLEFFNMVEDDD
jgi:beta-lactamase superfamily II metal-dependent hydrolase